MTELHRKLLLIIVVSLIGSHAVTTVKANVFDGTVSGKVTQIDGVTAISGATVKARQGTTIVATTTTNGTGDYTLSLAAGTYTVEASATGFGIKSQSPVNVTDSVNTTVNLKLDAIVSGPVSYLYDPLGRLVATVGPTETTIYTYDAVGNLLSISRQAATQLAIISVVPGSGSVGQVVTIYGTGFSPTPSENEVKFNNVSTSVMSATSTRLIVTVPSVGVTGQIQVAVTTSQGTVSAPFIVLPASSGPNISVAPSAISILPGDALQFLASITGLTGDQSVQWSVNGVNGGNSFVGTITSTGFYTSPNQSNALFVIRATSVANPAVFGQAQVIVLDPNFAKVPVAGALSVLRPSPSSIASATSLSVMRRATDSVAAFAQLSVRRLSATDSGAPVAAALSVRRNDAAASGAPHSASLSLTTGPVVQSLTPTAASQSTNFTITISGANFDGTTGISFLTTAGAVDSNVSASNISVDPSGNSLTATITVSGSAALGQRVVVVTTGAGNSLTVSTGANVLEIVQ
ncbi:MAG TPA: carboxypeptidase regulatory-like domain-containing protein [Pyrinomonadaceae bacterium]